MLLKLVNDFTNKEAVQQILDSSSYSSCTKKNLLESYLVGHTDDVKMQELHAHYKNLTFAEYSLQKPIVPSMEKMRSLIDEHFPDTLTAKRLLLELYIFWPLRDDAQIVYGEVIDKNCLFYKGADLYIVIRKSKCIRSAVERKLPEGLATLFKDYIHYHRLQNGHFLFGNKKLTKIIRNCFKVMSLKGGINVLRRIHRNAAVLTQCADSIAETARNSFHSGLTPSHYTCLTNDVCTA
jgi:hypothetical protein